jgi:hypothetical protein
MLLLGSIVALTSACSRSGQPEPSGYAAVSASVAPPPASAAPAKEPAFARPTTERVVTGDGITITETTTGEVKLKTVTLWKEPVDTTYENCGFYLAALPVLKGQISEDRAKLLRNVCTGTTAPPK